MDLISTKILVAVLFGFLRFFFGILPVKLEKCLRNWEEVSTDSNTFINKKRHEQVTCAVALTQSFGGGVMFATCFLHMMKALFISIEEIKEEKEWKSEYPTSQLIISLSFFFVYFLEEFIHWIVTKTSKRFANRVSINNVVPSSGSSNKVTPIKTVETIEEWDLNEKNKKLTDDFENDKAALSTPVKLERTFSRSASASSRRSIKKEIEKENSEAQASLQLTAEDEENLKNQEQLMRCVFTIVALSLHSLLEGLSIGIQKTRTEIWYLFIAVSIHSASILFCMGVELILAQTKVRFILLQVTVLAIASPIGVLLGLLVTLEASEETPTVAIAIVCLEGLSAGTILYITFFEVLNREKERRVYRFRRSLCILGGFVLMATLQWIESINSMQRRNVRMTLKQLNATTE